MQFWNNIWIVGSFLDDVKISEEITGLSFMALYSVRYWNHNINVPSSL